MTRADLMELLRKVVSERGQATVARDLGYSPSALSQVLSGKYQGDLTNMLTRVDEVYGSTSFYCPVFGEEITLGRCAEERRKLPRYTNPVARLLTATCPTCDRRRRP